MAKPQSRYVCQACGAGAARWAGRCDSCGAWNSIVEEAPRESAPGGLGRTGGKRAKRVSFVGLEGESPPEPRFRTEIAEFDRVCGGGLVPGSAVLIAGDPGIGKSTLLLQVVAALGRRAAGGPPCAYVSGEEAVDQLR
ncbi:MAG TPA: ATPase domain-containing protein, partial [Kiloniellales bacterium]|nr:ATPase domain-containing protein [Kiloniellales bacterium]